MGLLSGLRDRGLSGARRGLDRAMPDRGASEPDPPVIEGGKGGAPTASASENDENDESGRSLRWRLLVFAAVTLALLLPGSLAIGVVGNDEGTGALPEGWERAERIVTTTSADGRPGSLRDAVDSATRSGTDTVIVLKPTTYRLTKGCRRTDARPGEGSDENDNEGGDLDLSTVGGGIRIEGNGATVVQECPGQRVLHVTGDDRVDLSKVTLAGGQATAPLGQGSGGALLSEGSSEITISDSMLTSNSAEDTGGAVTLSGPPAQLNLIRSVVSGNSAGSAGGGVWVLGDLHATNSTITNNLAMTNGGAVATNATLVFSTIVDNSTTSPSGGRQLGAVNLDSFAGYVAGGAGAPNSCSVERATSHGYNVGDDPSCGFGSGVGDLSDGPRDGVGLLGYYQGDLQERPPVPARPPVPNGVLVDRVPPPTCLAHVKTDGQGRSRSGDRGCDVGPVELPVGLDVPMTATPARVAAAVSGRATYTG